MLKSSSTFGRFAKETIIYINLRIALNHFFCDKLIKEYVAGDIYAHFNTHNAVIPI